MDYDEEDFVFYGTPIEREEELTSRKKKALAESAGNLRSLPSWKQEVRDEEGRRRFHGAFTGGFSAGYYNSVGSKEGWAPQSFMSSRKNRAEVKQQSILNFLDEDEKADLEGRSLSTSSQFDTFGFTAAELARKQAEKEQQQRPSAIPGPVPDEIVLPVTESIGVKLLKRMGWRQGRSIDESHANSLYDARREARKAFLAFTFEESKTECAENKPFEAGIQNLQELTMDNDAPLPKSTPIYVLNPKQDLHGLGYDPYKNAPEFREKKRLRTSGHGQARTTLSTKDPRRDNLFGFRTGNIAPGFGIGALEELDAEDEDVYAPGYDFVDTSIEEVDESSRLKLDLPDRPRLTAKDHETLHGFKLAPKTDYQLERFDPPVIPKDFEPHHNFPGPLEIDNRLSDPPPPEAVPPEDNYVKILIDGVAALVARCGKLFEDLSREKNQSNPFYSFLNGGSFSDYYTRRLWEERQKRYQTKVELEGKLYQDVPPITAETRGRILGERPLNRNSVAPNSSNATMNVKPQTNLLDTSAKPAVSIELLEASKPFKDDPAKQKRFDQFIKEKYQGGLRSASSGGASNMSEAERARERLDFEAAVEAIERGHWGKEANKSAQRPMEFSATGALQFTSSRMKEVECKQDEDLAMNSKYPKREEFTWRPSPVLCKRFDLMDPYMGKPPPAPRMRSKMDPLVFMQDSVIPTQMEESVGTKKGSVHLPQIGNVESSNANDKEAEVQVEAENIERPVDLYKAIFSDDSDDEGETSAVSKMENPERKVEVANATLNRLIAGDFLESLGKELGLEVPPDRPPPTKKASIQTQKEAACSNAESANTPIVDGALFPSPAPQSGTSQSRHQDEEPTKEGIHDKKNISSNSISAAAEKRSSGHDINDMPDEDRKSKIKSDHHESWSSSSSEDERSRRSSKKHRYRYSSDSDSDSSGDYTERSKGRKKGSSREKRHSRRRESKHRKHKDRDSPSRSHRRKERHEAKRYKERLRD